MKRLNKTLATSSTLFIISAALLAISVTLTRDIPLKVNGLIFGLGLVLILCGLGVIYSYIPERTRRVKKGKTLFKRNKETKL